MQNAPGWRVRLLPCFAVALPCLAFSFLRHSPLVTPSSLVPPPPGRAACPSVLGVRVTTPSTRAAGPGATYAAAAATPASVAAFAVRVPKEVDVLGQHLVVQDDGDGVFSGERLGEEGDRTETGKEGKRSRTEKEDGGQSQWRVQSSESCFLPPSAKRTGCGGRRSAAIIFAVPRLPRQGGMSCNTLILYRST